MLIAEHFEDERFKVQFVNVHFSLATDPPEPRSQFADQTYWLSGMVPLDTQPPQWAGHRVEVALMNETDPACQEIVDYLTEFLTIHKLEAVHWEDSPKPGVTTQATLVPDRSTSVGE